MKINKIGMIASVALAMLIGAPAAWCGRDADDVIEHRIAKVLDLPTIEASAHKDAHIISKQVALESAQLSLIEVMKAQETATGAKVVRLEVQPFSLSMGPICYELILVKDRTVTQSFVNVTNGCVIEQRKPIWGYLAFSAWSKYGALGQVLVPMAQAIKLAETECGGKTAKVEICTEGGVVYYQIELIKDMTIRKVQVDSYMGKVRDLGLVCR